MAGTIRVLYVDDEPDLLEIARLFLEQDGEFTVTTALSAHEALERPDFGSSDAIIADFQMPEMNGIELLKEVRRRFGDLPFILFTGRGREEVVIEAINNGVDFYIQKGGSPEAQFAELAHKIRQAIGRRRADRERRESEKQLQDLINFLPDATFAIDRAGTIIAWNRAMEEMTGRPASEMMGKGEYEYALPFYGTRRPLLIDILFAPGNEIETNYASLRRDGDVLTAETGNARPRGRACILQVRATPLVNSGGEVTGAIESVRDITELKEAEAELRRSEERFRSIVNDQTEMILRFSRDGTVTFANEAFREIFLPMLPPGKLNGENIRNLLQIKNSVPRFELPGSLSPEKPIRELEAEITGPDGQARWTHWTIRALFDSGGNISEYQVVGRDITEKRLADAAIARSREYLDRIFSSVRAGIVLIDAATHDIIDINPAGAALIGLPREQITGTICHRFICPAEVGRCPITDLHHDVDNSERILINAQGEQIPIIKYVTRVSLDGRECLIETFIDNRERRKAEDALRESETRYHEMADLLPQMVFETDTALRLTYANRHALNVFGFSEKDFRPGFSVLSFIDPAEHGSVRDSIEKLLKGMPFEPKEYRARRPDGSTIPIVIYSSAIWRQGKLAGFRGVIVDISTRKKMEDALRSSEEKFRNIFENSPYPIAITDLPENRFIDINRAFIKVSGYTRDELIGKDPLETGFLPATEALRLISHRVIHGKIENVPLAVNARDNKRVHVLFSSFPLTVDGKPAVVTMAAEVTKLRRVEEELLKKNEDLNAAYEELSATEEELRQNYKELDEKEQELRAGEEKYRLLTEMIDDVIYRVDPKGIILHITPQIRRYGFLPDDVISRPFSDFIAEEDIMQVRESFRAAMKARQFTVIRMRIRAKDGSLHWVEDNGGPVLDASGNVIGITGILRNITARVRAEAEAEQSRERFRQVAENIGEWIWEMDAGGIFTYCSPVVTDILGHAPEDLTGKKRFSDLLMPPERETAAAGLQEAFRRRDPFTLIVHPVSRAKGSPIILEMKGSPVLAADGTLLGYRGAGRDVTDQKEADEALRASEEKFRALVENSLEGIFIIDFGGTLLFANLAAARIVEASDLPSLVGNANVLTFVAPESQEDVLRDVRNVLMGTDAYLVHYKLITETKRERWVECIGRKIQFGQSAAMLVSMRDVTERMEAENRIHETETKFSQVFRGNPVALTIVSANDGTFVDVNDAFTTITGYSREEAIGHKSEELGLFADPGEAGKLAAALRKDRIVQGMELRCRNRSGDTRIFRFSSGIIVMRGRPHILSTVVDINEQKEAEEALRASEEKFRSFVENATDIICSMTPEGIVTYVSPQWTELTGYGSGDLVGRSLETFLRPGDSVLFRKFLEDALQGRDTRSGTEFMIQHRNGSPIWLSTTVSPVLNSSKTIVSLLGILHNITGRKRDIEALRQANRKLSLLTGITRHDIRNQLTTLDGYIVLLKKKVPDPAFDSYFARVRNATTRISQMIEFTKEYDNVGVHAPAWQDIRTLAGTAAEDAAAGAIAVINEIPAGTEVYADPLIEKVFFNLTDNAVRHGGRITMVRLAAEKRDEGLVLTCSDDGEGIPAGEKEKIFHLGYGKNTGFGLSISQEILDITGISIRETGEPGTGARFEMIVPKENYRIAP